jgi:hypothetical protein
VIFMNTSITYVYKEVSCLLIKKQYLTWHKLERHELEFFTIAKIQVVIFCVMRNSSVACKELPMFRNSLLPATSSRHIIDPEDHKIHSKQLTVFTILSQYSRNFIQILKFLLKVQRIFCRLTCRYISDLVNCDTKGV